MDDAIAIESYAIKLDRKYTKTHEWIKKIDDDLWEIGISDYAQKMLREITYVQFEASDSEFEQEEVILTVEAIKASGDIYAPFMLKLVENNISLEDKPELLHEDPYTLGWLARFKALTTDMSNLLSPEQYKLIIAKELEEV